MFGQSMNRLLIGSSIAAGASYVRDEFFEGSFLKTVGDATGLGKYFDTPVGQAAIDIGSKFVSGTAKEMLQQGLGTDPSALQNMPEIRIPDRDTYQSDPLRRPNNYNGFPQGSKKILENAFKDSIVKDISMQYTQARIPKERIVNPTVRTGGIKELGALAKGQIQSLKS